MNVSQKLANLSIKIVKWQKHITHVNREWVLKSHVRKYNQILSIIQKDHQDIVYMYFIRFTVLCSGNMLKLSQSMNIQDA